MNKKTNLFKPADIFNQHFLEKKKSPTEQIISRNALYIPILKKPDVVDSNKTFCLLGPI